MIFKHLNLGIRKQKKTGENNIVLEKKPVPVASIIHRDNSGKSFLLCVGEKKKRSSGILFFGRTKYFDELTLIF